MKNLYRALLICLLLASSPVPLRAYERLQGPTQLIYWDKAKTATGYTFFGTQGNSYLLDMEGRVVHSWPLGTNPRLLDNGNLLDASSGDINAFPGFKELDWDGNTVWQHTETRIGYFPHHDFLRMTNKKLGASTTLYLANKTISYSQCIAAGCNPANGAYADVTVDAIVEVDASGIVVWEWCFFDHGVQDYSAAKSNYVGSGKSIATYPGKINLNLPGRPLQNDWLHCTSLDYNPDLDQIVISAEGGEFYVIDHGNTFIAGDPTGSIALAASSTGDFLYRFGDPARYGQGNPPSIQQNWTVSTTGNKQIGGLSQAQWIPNGLPGAGHFLVFNNGQDLFETTPQSYIFEVNGFINSGTTDTGAYVNPPSAGYYSWVAPGHDTDKHTKSMSKQIVSIFQSMANQAFFSHIGGSAQRLSNGNLLVCSAAEGHLFEVTSAGEAVWEYINPVTADGILAFKRDNWPLSNPVYRATRFSVSHPALLGRTLAGANTITGGTASYISAPTISGVTLAPASPTQRNAAWVTATVTNSSAIAAVKLTYLVGGTTSTTVSMLDDGAHLDGAAGDGCYGAEIPVLPVGTVVNYYLSAMDGLDNTAASPTGAPTTLLSYTVADGGTNSGPTITSVSNTSGASGNSVWVTAHVRDDLAVGSVALTYSTGATASLTNTAFLETMGTNAVKPWTGSGCDNAWTVSFTGTNPFEQRTGSNYGSGNPNGLEFKNGTANLSDSEITTTQGIDARGNGGTISFYVTTNGLTNNAGWEMQLNAGTGFTTRLSELTASNHPWQLYTYSLLPGDLVSNLLVRFQFRGGGLANRIDLDQISVKTLVNGTATTTVAMLDDGIHGDGVAGDGIYGAEIPAQASGNLVNYTISATDGEGSVTNSPASGTGATYSYTVTDSIPLTPQYVRIPGGSFSMGDHFGFVDEKHPNDELPLHTVTVSAFNMSTTLLTCREYCDYLNSATAQGQIEVRAGSVYAVGGTNTYIDTATADPYSTIQWNSGSFAVRGGRDLHPATGVRWFGAIAYCNWLSARDGFDSCYDLSTGACDMTKNGYRLPTEAEWEYAARGGQTTTYRMFPWGDDTSADGALANWEGSGDPWESDAYPQTTPVGFYNGAIRYKTAYNWPSASPTYQTRDGSNAFGLYDMAGNVWEWINDWYQASYYQTCLTNNIVTDPPGPSTGDPMPNGLPCRGLRGGTWWNGGGQTYYGYSRVSNRDPSYYLGPNPGGGTGTPWFQVGFRVMRPEKTTQTVGLFLSGSNVAPGYTLMSPMQGYNTYLLNNAGQQVHKWTSHYNPGRADYLLENGHLIRECSVPSIISTGGGEGGRIEEYDWEGNLVWAYDLNTSVNMTHHDFKVLPNGNVLMLAVEVKSMAEVLAAGFNPALLDSLITTTGFMLPDYVIEVEPIRPYGGKIVWEWHAWDHIIQDFDSSKNNFGTVAAHPELINANGGGAMVQQFWNHFNAIDYNAGLDQIALSCRNNSEAWIIDHKTTPEEASSHAGGRYDKGGDLLYRWGNPLEYKLGTAANRMLYQQHDVQWIAPNSPGAGHLLIFNNGIGRGYSTIDEIVLPVDAAGNYTRTTGTAFGPAALYWTYKKAIPTDFYSFEISGAQRQPNGNTLVCEGVLGTLFEVTSTGQIVWRYVNPETHSPLAQGSVIPPDLNKVGENLNTVFKVHRYAPDYPGLAGKDLTPRGTIETYSGASTDTVGLGLPDIWVRSHFGSLSAVTAITDHDGDGILDITEYAFGLDPTKADSDGDGIPDGWEIAYGLDPSYSADAGTLGDNGCSLLQSYVSDLNPDDPSSQLKLTQIGVSGSNVMISWVGGTNAWQSIEYSPTLVGSAWTVLSVIAPPTPVTNQVIHQGGASQPRGFYRLKAWR